MRREVGGKGKKKDLGLRESFENCVAKRTDFFSSHLQKELWGRKVRGRKGGNKK